MDDSVLKDVLMSGGGVFQCHALCVSLVTQSPRYQVLGNGWNFSAAGMQPWISVWESRHCWHHLLWRWHPETYCWFPSVWAEVLFYGGYCFIHCLYQLLSEKTKLYFTSLQNQQCVTRCKELAKYVCFFALNLAWYQWQTVIFVFLKH